MQAWVSKRRHTASPLEAFFIAFFTFQCSHRNRDQLSLKKNLLLHDWTKNYIINSDTVMVKAPRSWTGLLRSEFWFCHCDLRQENLYLGFLIYKVEIMVVTSWRLWWVNETIQRTEPNNSKYSKDLSPLFLITGFPCHFL